MARSQRQRERHQGLLQAARSAVIAHGTEVKLSQIAEHAGLTASAVLYHYPDVQTLVLEANRAGMERFYDQRMQAIEGLADPAERLVVTIRSGLPVDSEDEAVQLFCELGGAAARHPMYGALLTTLYDRQVAMYQVILESGAAVGAFELTHDATTIARNFVALEDAYGYRIVAGHPTIDNGVAAELILEYARAATGHPLNPKETT